MSFSFLQAGAQATGTGSVQPALTTGSAGATHVIAVLVSPTTNETGFSTGAGDGWLFGKSVTLPGIGDIETWYYPNAPAGTGFGSAIPTFTGESGTNCRGGLIEFSTAANTTIVLNSVGQAAGTSGLVYDVASACGNTAGDLCIALYAAIFTAGPASGNFSTPAGYTFANGIHSGTANTWGAYYNTSLSAASQQIVNGGSTFAGATLDGWMASLAIFREVQFQNIHLDGGEMLTMSAIDPTGQITLGGGDVEGIWRSADFGNSWQTSDLGLYNTDWNGIANITWSKLEAGVAYACVGKGKTGGAFFASIDGGLTWAPRSSTLSFNSNAATIRPASEGQDVDRSTGNLLVQDTNNGYLYAATYNNGIWRSNNTGARGTSWTQLSGLTGSNYYPRCIAINPSNYDMVFVGTWDSDGTGTYDGVWQSTNVQGSGTFTQFGTGLPQGSVSDLKILGSYLYATVTTHGVYRIPVSGGAWASLNGSYITTSSPFWSVWTTLDGWIDSSGNHQILAGCDSFAKRTGGGSKYTNIVQISVPSTYPTSGSLTYADLTSSTPIDIQTLPGTSPVRTWWKFGSSWTYWLGGNGFVNPHILVDTLNLGNIYVSGAGGFFRTFDYGAHWTVAVNGMPMAAIHNLAVDPNDSNHVVLQGSDFTQTDLQGDPTGATYADITVVSPVAGESHCAVFDPLTSDCFIGQNTKYGQNAGGTIFWRTEYVPSVGNPTWHNTGYASAVPAGNAPMGMFAGRYTDNSQYLCAAAQGSGMWRAVPNGTNTNPWTWTKVNSSIGTGGAVNQSVQIVADGQAAGVLYCYDRPQGLFRSTNYGQSWSLVYSAITESSDGRSGWIAASPSTAGLIWMSNSTGGLYKITGAQSGTITGADVTSMATFANGAGSMALSPDGSIVYAVLLNGSGQQSAVLYSSSDGGASWQNAGGTTIGSYVSQPGPMAIASDGLLMLGSGYNWGVYGQAVGDTAFEVTGNNTEAVTDSVSIKLTTHHTDTEKVTDSVGMHLTVRINDGIAVTDGHVFAAPVTVVASGGQIPLEAPAGTVAVGEGSSRPNYWPGIVSVVVHPIDYDGADIPYPMTDNIAFLAAWDVLSAVTATTTVDWDTLKRVTSTATVEWDTEVRLSSSELIEWSTLIHASSTASFGWNSIERVFDAPTGRPVAPVLVGPLVRPIDAPITEPSAETATWNTVGRVSSTATVEWNILLGPIASKAEILWNTRKEVKSVPPEIEFNTLKRVTSTTSCDWDVLERVSKTATCEWATVGRIHSGTFAEWNTEQRRTTVPWFGFYTLPISSWNVLVVQPRVRSSRSFGWNTLQRVTFDDQLVGEPGLLSPVVHPIDYDIPASGTPETAEWSTLKRVSSTTSCKWDMVGRVSSTTECEWKTVGRTSSATSCTWSTRVPRTSTETCDWRTLGGVTTTRTCDWNTQQRPASTATVKWNTLYRVDPLAICEWNTIQRPHSSATILWETWIDPVTTTATCEWDTLKRVTSVTDSRWDSDGRMSVSLSSQWVTLKSVVSSTPAIEWDVGQPVQIGIRLLSPASWSKME